MTYPTVRSLTLLLASLTAFFAAAPRASADPVTAFVLSYVADKVVNEVWDSATGYPDVRQLERRLNELESNAAMRGEMSEAIKRLRESVNSKVSKEEFLRKTQEMVSELTSIKQRLDSLEQRVEKLEVENEDRKHNSKNSASAAYFLSRGDEFIKNGNSTRAMANYNIAIELDPSIEQAYAGRNRIYKDMRAWGVVAANANEASQKCRPVPAWTRRDRALATWEIQKNFLADCPLRLYDFDFSPYDETRIQYIIGKQDAQQVVSDCTETDGPLTHDLFVLRGTNRVLLAYTQLQEREFDMVMRILKDGKPTPPKPGERGYETYQRNATVEARRDRLLEQAISDFDEAIKLCPTSAMAHAGRAIAASRLLWGRVDSARMGRSSRIAESEAKQIEKQIYDDLSVCVRSEPNVKIHLIRRARSHYSEDTDELKLKDVSAALALDADDLSLRKWRAYLRKKTGDFKGAIDDYLVAVQVDSDDADMYFGLHDCYVHLGDKKKAEHYLSLARANYKRK